MIASDAGMEFSFNRVAAMVRRYWYLLRSSWPRILDLIYWPTVQMLMWGFLQVYISQNSNFFVQAGGVFIGSVLLWDILFRGQLGFSISFLEEMYARNLGNLMMSPLRPAEFLLALMIMSIVRLSIGMIPVSLLAIAFFGFNLWALGLALAASARAAGRRHHRARRRAATRRVGRRGHRGAAGRGAQGGAGRHEDTWDGRRRRRESDRR